MTVATYTQQVMQVGYPPIHGVISKPKNLQPDPIALILLNAGFLHHVGSCDFSVKLSRKVGSIGMPAVRFDFSGIGDSPARQLNEQESYELAAAQVIEVLDHLQHYEGWQRFIVGGLCSGADHGFAAACQDERVEGLLQIDPYVYRTKKWYVNHYLPRLVNSSSWRRFINRSSAPKQVRGLPQEILERDGAAGRTMRSRAEVAAGYRKLTDRKVKILAIMTRGQLDHYNYQGQLKDIFSDVDLSTCLTEVFYPKTRHIITEPEDQASIIERISNWCATL